MNIIRFYGRLTLRSLRLYRKLPILILILAIACSLVSFCSGRAAQAALSRGVSFTGLTLAVAQEEGDRLPALLAEQIQKMSDVSQYCKVLAMPEAEARAALEAGEITAIVRLPEGFVQGVMNGENPDVELIVSGRNPTEALLTLWLGQSATDLLSAVQAGIYAVLDVFAENPTQSHTWDQVVKQINLVYISWTMNRYQLFDLHTCTATGALPVPVHYGLSLLAFLAMAVAPLFAPVFSPDKLRTARRFRAAGWNYGFLYLCDFSACVLILSAFFLIPWFLVTKNVLAALAGTLITAIFCGSFAGFCCLLTQDIASCSGLSFFLALGSLVLSGGILPPVLLPEPVRMLLPCSPITWLRNAAVLPLQAGSGWYLLPLAAAAAAMALCSIFLYRRRMDRREDSL